MGAIADDSDVVEIPSPTQQYGHGPADEDDEVYIPDKGLVAAIRYSLGRRGSPITEGDMLRLTNLREKHDSEGGIEDLTGLEFAHNLFSIDLAGGSIRSIADLRSLYSLEHLHLGDQSIASVAPLRRLSELRQVTLSDNPIASIAGIGRHPHLFHLILSGALFEDTTPLLGSRNVENLSLHRTPVANLDGLLGMTKLKWLDASKEVPYGDDWPGALSDISGLNFSTNMEWLNLRGNSISDVSPLSLMDKLLDLDLDFNLVRDVGPLFGLRALEYLGLERNLVSDVMPLAGLHNLRYLDLRENTVKDVFYLANLTSLLGLDLAYNEITSVWWLTTLPNLRQLNVSYNNIRDFTTTPPSRAGGMDHGATSLAAPVLHGRSRDASPLEELNLEGNSITDVTALEDFPDLERLDLSHNNIADIGPLSTLRRLESADLRGNLITDIEPLLGLPELRDVHLDDNPLSEESINEHLPALRNAGVSISSKPPESEVTYVVPFFPSTLTEGREGFVRVVNESDSAGEIRIVPMDDGGRRFDSVTLSLGARQTAYFNSRDLEMGNPQKGLVGSTGGPGEGDWRLRMASELPFEALSYVRTDDGFLTAMHDVVPSAGSRRHKVAIFNPGSNEEQRSVLRLINPGDDEATVNIVGLDDRNLPPRGPVVLSVEAGAVRMLTSRELESGGDDLTGALGDGDGKWRLTVDADQPILAMSLLENPTGHVTNLSTAPVSASGEVIRVPLLPSAFDPSGRQGFVRVINHSSRAGEAVVTAYDDAGRKFGPLALQLAANETVHFNSEDLETGNPEKGLAGGTGFGIGDWRLEMSSDLSVEVLSYIRTKEDGFLTSMHDVVAGDAGQYRIPIFNPGENVNQVGVLRIVNDGEYAAEITVRGVDDDGESPGTDVLLSLPGGMARSMTSLDLEEGADHVDGALGDGAGKWQLLIDSSQPIMVMSLLRSPTGHLTNLSTIPRQGGGN